MIRLDWDEKYYLDLIRNYFRSHRPLDNVLRVADFGGASGSYTEYVRQTFWDFHTRFLIAEPVPESYANLRKTYKGMDTILLEKVAISDKHGAGWLDVGENTEHSSLVPGGYENTRVRVKTETADTVLAKLGLPHILKIDVEGEELNVLRGASEALANSVQFIQFEYGGSWVNRGSTMELAHQILEKHGYKLWQAAPYGHSLKLVPASRVDDWGMRNILAVHRSGRL